MAHYFYKGDKVTANHTACATGKRGYRSRKHAMEAHRRASYRLRPYFCNVCSLWHTTNEQKR